MRQTVRKKLFLMIIMVMTAMNVAGQEQDTIGSVHPQEGKPTLMDRVHQLQQYLDYRARMSVDSHYIAIPEKPWAVIARYRTNAVDVDYSNSFAPSSNGYMDWDLHFLPPTARSLGLTMSYRGTGVTLSVLLAKNAGRYFAISTTGAKYGFNFRLRRFSTYTTTLSMESYKNGEQVAKEELDGDLVSPVWIRSVYLNGYYVFNGRRYSQAAAYNQSVIQRRSAGSLLLGAPWHQSSFDYSDIQNAMFMEFGNNVGRIKVHQANIGLGYGYNWVPLRGLVVNAMVMPTLSVYNRVKIYKYDYNYVLPLYETSTEGYGTWNTETKTWSNGKVHKPLPNNGDIVSYPDDAECWETGTETEYSWLHFNLDMRLGIAYNWKNYLIGFQAQYNNLRYKKDNCKVNIFDADASLSFGVRF